MGLIINPLCTLFALLWLGASLPLQATPIYPDSMPPQPAADWSLEEKRRYTIALMETSPLRTDRPITIPELGNPLATEGYTLPRIFGKNIYFADLLATPEYSDHEILPVILPDGALEGVDILEDVDALFLSYDNRAYDQSVLEVDQAEISSRHGLPITIDGTPLYMRDFGEIIRARNLSATSVVPPKDEATQP